MWRYPRCHPDNACLLRQKHTDLCPQQSSSVSGSKETALGSGTASLRRVPPQRMDPRKAWVCSQMAEVQAFSWASISIGENSGDDMHRFLGESIEAGDA